MLCELLRMNITQAKAIVGSDLGNPSKMPGFAIGLSADHCKVGAKLAEKPGSACATCYAKGANYQYPSVKTSHARRLAGLEHPQWVDAMATLINSRCSSDPWFRWHDSGDIQSLDHLHAIVEVCRATPSIRHWLPTHERGMIRQFAAMFGEFPENLTVRLSDAMVDARAPRTSTLPTAGIATDKTNATCPAYNQGGRCNDCRKCWDRNTARVVYPLH